MSTPENEGPQRPDDAPQETTWAGNRPLTSRWWWSPTLMIVVGLAVVAYQLGAVTGGDALWITWVMIVVGSAVAVAGVISLVRALRAEQARPSAGPAGTAPR